MAIDFSKGIGVASGFGLQAKNLSMYALLLKHKKILTS